MVFRTRRAKAMLRFRRRPRRVTQTQRQQQLVTGRRPRPAQTMSMYQVKRAVSRLLNNQPEHKEFYVTSNQIIPGGGAGGQIVQLTQSGQGLGSSNRVGSSVNMTSLQINGHITININNNATAQWYRVVIFIDKQYHSELGFALTDLYNTTSVTSLTNPDNTDRFIILKDITFSLSKQSLDYTKVFKWFKKMPLNVKYADTASDATPAENNVFILFYGDQASDEATFTFNSKFKFTDN